ncbi:MAG: heme-copper oxidase subunit III [Salinimicrobium sp.]
MRDKSKMLMYFLIGSEAFFFIALIIAYVYYRNFSGATDTVAEYLNVQRASILTVCLMSSSFTLIAGKKQLIKGNIPRFKLFTGITLSLAVIFLAGQLYEYLELYKKQVTISDSVFGSSFFTLTGFHGMHVFLGLVAISLLFVFSFGKFRILISRGIHSIELYWHFVDVVWLFIFFFVYISPLL